MTEMTHEHIFTCAACGKTDDEKSPTPAVKVYTLTEREEQDEVLEPWR
jgi:hypothetical protein